MNEDRNVRVETPTNKGEKKVDKVTVTLLGSLLQIIDNLLELIALCKTRRLY